MTQHKVRNRWADVGISEPGRIGRLLYSRPSETLVVVFHREVQSRSILKRLFLRAIEQGNYHPIAAQDSLESQEDAVCCDAVPYLIYNQMRCRTLERGSLPVAMDWVGIRKFNLTTKISEIVLDSQSLRAPLPYVQGWVSGVISAWPNGLGAVCSIGLMGPEDKGRQVVDYFVYDVSFIDGLGRRILALPHSFL